MTEFERTTQEASPKKRKKIGVVLGVVAAVVVAAGAGFWVWHEQPSFCAAICHEPMDPYLETYEQPLNQPGVDKWGNEVENTSSMLAVTHKAMGDACLDCHIPTLSEQVSEGIAWVTGDFDFPLIETTTKDLVAARGLEADEFCLNGTCHDMTRDDLVAATADMARNPHESPHGKMDCSTCHKAHRASVMYCSDCHNDCEIPTGWLTNAESKALVDSVANA